VTALERAVPAHFGLATPDRLAEAIHLGEISQRRVHELAPVVFTAAAHDAVAAGIVERLAGEVAAFARAAIARLGLAGPVEVLLGGGLMRAAPARLLAAVEAELSAIGSGVAPRVVADPPIVGAALLGLDDVGAGPEARSRARRELHDAVAGIGTHQFIGSVGDG
jgi:N-acetylglucosamine kinase-like BadF-type ATPase